MHFKYLYQQDCHCLTSHPTLILVQLCRWFDIHGCSTTKSSNTVSWHNSLFSPLDMLVEMLCNMSVWMPCAFIPCAKMENLVAFSTHLLPPLKEYCLGQVPWSLTTGLGFEFYEWKTASLGDPYPLCGLQPGWAGLVI